MSQHNRPLKFLTVKQPWASCMFLPDPLRKNIENRTWTRMWRGDILIHAGSGYAPHAMDWIRQHVPEAIALLPERFPTGGIIGIVTLDDIVTEHASPWFIGQFGWVLSNARPLPFTPMSGGLGLLDPPDHVLRALLGSLK